MEEGTKGWGEQWKKCLGWALSAFYLMGSLPRQGLPPAEPTGRSNERRVITPPPPHGPLPARKRKGGKSKWPRDANSSHPSWRASGQLPSIHGGPGDIPPSCQRGPQRDPDVVSGVAHVPMERTALLHSFEPRGKVTGGLSKHLPRVSLGLFLCRGRPFRASFKQIA